MRTYLTKRISAGGWIAIGYALIWAILVTDLLGSRSGGHGYDFEELVVWMTLPLGLIDSVGEIFSIRGVMGLNEVLTCYFLMIPNFFIVGYFYLVLKCVGRLLRWMARVLSEVFECSYQRISRRHVD